LTLEADLERIAGAGSPADISRLTGSAARTALRDPDAPETLARKLASSDAAQATAAQLLLTTLLDEARMSVENGGAAGGPFLAAIAAALRARVAEDALPREATGLAVQAYGRAGVDVPDFLIDHNVAQMEAYAAQSPPSPRAMRRQFEKLLRVSADPFVVYESFREAMAGMPAEMKPGLVRTVLAVEQSVAARLTAFWLLDPAPAIREAAAVALGQSVRSGKCDGALLRKLTMLRSWMPADPARALVDAALRDARLREMAVKPAKPAATAPRCLMTLVDGAGAQNVAIVVGRKLIMLLFKVGHGVKDGHVVSARTDRELQEILAELDEIEPHRVGLETVETALAAALADGLAHGAPPAPALAEIVGMLGLEHVRPMPASPRDWLSRLDPEDAISGLSAQKRGRLINASANWIDRHAILDSWSEESAALSAALATADTNEQQRLVWVDLSLRRDAWALRFLQSAWALKGAGEPDWLGFAVTAKALLDGRPVAKVPVMELILTNTLRAHFAEAGAPLDPILTQLAGISAVAPQSGGPAALAAWRDAFIVAMVVSPRDPEPVIWLAILAQSLGVEKRSKTLDRFAADINIRYSLFWDAFEAGRAIDGAPADLRGVEAAAWAKGFIDAMQAFPNAWPRSDLSKGDRQFIETLQRVARGDPNVGVAPDPQKWLRSRFKRN